MLKVLHMYPELLNLYSDRGNLLTIKQRCSWRNIEVKVTEAGINTPFSLRDADILFLGGGTERCRQIALANLLQYRKEFVEATEKNAVVLAVGSGYQMLGKHFYTSEGAKMEG